MICFSAHLDFCLMIRLSVRIINIAYDTLLKSNVWPREQSHVNCQGPILFSSLLICIGNFKIKGHWGNFECIVENRIKVQCMGGYQQDFGDKQVL